MRTIWIVPLLLAACVGAPESGGEATGPGRIVITSGSSIGAREELRVLADGSYTTERSNPATGAFESGSGQVDPAAYRQAREMIEDWVVAQPGLAVPSLCSPDTPNFTIRFEPPVRGKSVLSQCHGRDVADFISQLKRTLLP